MGFNRRTFLTKAGLGLAALGVSETLLSLLGDKSLAVPVLDRYFQALAQPGGRKLALLVGINQYPRITGLGGCVTDIELQRELLIHRFGFKSSDVLTLTDSQATRNNIETAFVEHLTEQAKAGDVVVFHFSGYGSRVKMNQESNPDQPVVIQNSLVPSDGILPVKTAVTGNDVLEETLVLLLLSLATEHITTVLDTSHSDVGAVLQGNLRVRSCPSPSAQMPSPEELAFQDQLRERSNSLWAQLKNVERLNQMPGVIFTAAGPTQVATEAMWNGFSAGLFTYALTQYLWQATPATTVQISLSRAAETVNQLVGKEQQPRLMNDNNLHQPLLAYYLPPDPTMGADGVVMAVEENGKAAQLWLAGLPATVLDHYGINSVLELVSSRWGGTGLMAGGSTAMPQDSTQPISNTEQPTNKPWQLQLRSKEGLIGKARIVGVTGAENSLQVGQLVQEMVRVLPQNLGLTIALDAGLERIERVDATSAFASIPYVSSVVVAGEQPADYLFGKLLFPATSPSTVPTANSAPRPEGSDSGLKTEGYGLFDLARNPMRNTAGEASEAVKLAVNRLSPKLKTLLAAKWLRLTANEGSSRLGIRASVEMGAPDNKVVMQQATLRAMFDSQGGVDKTTAGDLMASKVSGSVPTLPIGGRIKYRLENYSDSPLYFLLLGFDTNGSAIAFYKVQSLPTTDTSDNNFLLTDAVIAPGETLTLPQSATANDWVVSGPSGLVEIQLICSQAPFTKALKAMEATRRPKGEGERIADLFNPLEVTRALLQDLHRASAMSLAKTAPYAAEAFSTASDTFVLDVNAWATLSFIYQVV